MNVSLSAYIALIDVKKSMHTLLDRIYQDE